MPPKFPFPPTSFIGKHILELPTPSFILSRPVIESNAARMLKDIETKKLAFRPHVKTLKSCEAVEIMLGGKHKNVVVSTLREAWGLMPLVKAGKISEILYGMPLRTGALPELCELAKHVKILLLIDHIQHLDLLESFQAKGETSGPWEIFVKIDVGSHRAGISPTSPRLGELLTRVRQSQTVSLYGLYAYGGQSYDCTTPGDAEKVLHVEILSLIKVVREHLGSSTRPIVLSFGTTPTAHVVSSLHDLAEQNTILELHPGNYIANDLMQVSSGSVNTEDQAARVLVEVCGLYPERHEAIINAGVLALTSEKSVVAGFANIIGTPDWYVKDLSQEHGILASKSQQGDVEKTFKIGDKLLLHVAHSCITAAAYPHYFVVDGIDVVREVWNPWKGW